MIQEQWSTTSVACFVSRAGRPCDHHAGGHHSCEAAREHGLVQLDVALQLWLGSRRPWRHPVAEVLRQDEGDLVVAAAQRVRITGPLVFGESIHYA